MGDTCSTGEKPEFVAARANHPSMNSLYDTCEFDGKGIFAEIERYATIETLQMLDTEITEQPFNRITQLMTKVFQTPVSLITLVADPGRVWFKSKVGPFGACVDRDGSWCNYVLVPSTPEILITEDASRDARLAHNPYVAGEPFIKFYAGAPLVGSCGERYGTLCIVDLKQRAFTAELYALLNNFAALAVEEIERNKPLMDIVSEAATNDVVRNRSLDMSLTASRDGVIMLDVRENGWPITYANPAFEASSGLDLDDLAGSDFWELFDGQGKDELDLAAILGVGDAFQLRFFCGLSNRWLTLRLMPATSDRLAPSKATGIPSWVPSVEDPPDTTLGLDVDDDKKVDVTKRDIMDVPDAKCFWFAIVLAVDSESVTKSQSDTKHSSAGKSSGGKTSSTRQSTEASLHSHTSGKSAAGYISGFGEYNPPAELSQLRLGPLLGSGSFGKVYRGTSEGAPVAVKVIDCRGRGEGATSEQLDEVKLTCDLDHPGVVKTLAHNVSMADTGGNRIAVAWIVLELCDMGHLHDAAERGWLRVKRHITAPPDMATVLPTLRDIADAMVYVHDKSIIHADLTGRNVLLTSSASDPRGFVAKVCDFGLSRLTKDGPIETNVMGTITHMPPELLMKNLLSPVADVWAFGIIGWEAYYGKKIYCGKSPPQIIMTVKKNIPLEWPAEAPQEFVSLMKKALEFDYKKRVQFIDVTKALDSMIPMGLSVPVDPSKHQLEQESAAKPE
mmetsp:Transcript_93865/g.265557  ORF Transcript_93865/g.265557 Transcript_93865/m.265557 type:complete len:731 (-) Transcript_93865:150-2342(-)|eukprot:CAMPEP_0168448020 /NCGR_PEP_ID=MMETSP0228-20121227/46884_1 /TAXON_ID=133427 /ORGANISM="Protoceratium reticulatum, Strain CCCM 535 (=CCMP 1889)" /LENGTH=730 /DNA_ID=CAMNT_0008462551 /DNA_START=80 /DNA_END=2272 /DNA_ORIENTATION=+